MLKPISRIVTVIEDMRQSSQQLSGNLNQYYRSVGGDPVGGESGSTRTPAVPRIPLQTPSLGEIKNLLSQLDTTQAISHEDFPTWLSTGGREDVCVPLHDIIDLACFQMGNTEIFGSGLR